MAVSSSVPDVVDIKAYAGDTYTRQVVFTDPTFIGGRVWSAQVRAAGDASIVDATFTIVPDATGCTYTLTAADTQALWALSVTRPPVGLTAAPGYSGVWDLQLAPVGGGDPTVTICRGAVSVLGDVTRNV